MITVCEFDLPHPGVSIRKYSLLFIPFVREKHKQHGLCSKHQECIDIHAYARRGPSLMCGVSAFAACLFRQDKYAVLRRWKVCSCAFCAHAAGIDPYDKAAEAPYEMVSFSNSFHGRTLGALALTYKDQYKTPFTPIMPGALMVPYMDLDAAAAVIKKVRMAPHSPRCRFGLIVKVACSLWTSEHLDMGGSFLGHVHLNDEKQPHCPLVDWGIIN